MQVIILIADFSILMLTHL